MRAQRALVLAVVASLTYSARARAVGGSASLEAGTGQSQQGPAIPTSVFEYQRLSGRFDATEKTSLGATLRLTRDFAPGADPSTSLRTGADWVWFGTLDLTQELDDHFTLGASLTGSPPSSRDIVGSLAYVSGAATSALVHAQNANAGASADITYDSFTLDGPSHVVDVSWDAALGYAWFTTQQALAQIDESSPGSPSACAGPGPGGCTKPSPNASDALSQLRMETSLTGTLAEKSDLGVDFAYYVYAPGNPSNVGLFQSELADAKGRAVGAASWGTGLPLLPARFTLRPELAQRLGPLSLRAFYQFTDYSLADWTGQTVGGKAQLRTGTWKVYATGYYRWDDEAGTAATAWTAGLGLAKDL